jgi:hypothetical protein
MDRQKLPLALATAVGITIGWSAGQGRAKPVVARDAVQTDGSSLLSGQIDMRMHPSLKVNLQQDAIYYLDYRKGRLSAAVPSYYQVGERVRLLGEFSSRDLIADFQLPPGVTPHFSATVADLGGSSNGSGLFVVETTTGRIGSYLCEASGGGVNGELAPKFRLVEMQNLP